MNARLLALVLGLGLVACGDKDKVPDDTAPPETTPDDTGPDTTENFVDEDGDGYLNNVDCDDNDYRVHPDADELCDEIDNDCDDEVDEDFDADGDGHYSAAQCDYGDDCDDGDAASHPGAEEVPYDGVDQDCDGDDVTDVDGDGFIAEEAGGNDCDDTNADVNPAAEEIPFDKLDNDCQDGDSADADGDGYNDENYGGDDCDDSDPSVHPGAFNWWNDGIDTDCSGDAVGDYQALNDAAITIDGVYDGSSSTGYFYDLLGYGIDACDLDEDGLDDLLVGAPFSNSYGGGVGIWYGNGADIWTGGMLLEDADSLIVGSGYDFIGFDVACTDIDGDGHLDVVVDRGEIDYSSYQADFGLLIYYGDGNAFDPSLTDNQADAELTLEMEVPSGEPTVYSTAWDVGDLDGDGASEVVIEWGSDSVFEEADLLVIPGGIYAGNLQASDYIEDWADGTQEFSLANVRVLQDIDGDGLQDLFAGEAYYSSTDTPDTGDTGYYLLDNWSQEGQALLVSDLSSLEENDLAAAAYATIAGVTEAMFGWDAAMGDFDGDGSDDAAIAAVLDDSGADDGGGLYAFYAATSLFAGGGEFDTDDAGGHVYGTYDDGELGIQLEAAGDMDGDGYGDLLISEPGGGVFDVGRVYLLSGDLLASDLSAEDASLMGFEGSDSDNAFATDIIAGFDFDGDGIGDIAISALGWDDTDDGSIHAGRVVIYLSSTWM